MLAGIALASRRELDIGRLDSRLDRGKSERESVVLVARCYQVSATK